jgi:Fungal specific transcription factor domain
LEKLWALCMGKIDGLEEAVVELMQHQDEIKTIWNHETVGEELHGSWKESSVLNELVGLLSKLEATAHESVGKRKRERDGSDSEGTLETTFHRDLEYVIQSTRISADRRPRESLHAQAGLSRTVSGVSNPVPTKVVAKSTITSISDSGIGDSISYLSTLPFPARTPSLLELYFSHTHCWFPILERHHILRISYSCSSKQQRPESISSADLATLWALLAYVDNQYAHISSEPRVAREMDAAEMLAVAMKLMPPFGSCLFEIGHVQALLLIALNSIGSSWNRAWIFIGHAVRIAIDLNVGQVTARGKHVLFGCFILDTLISARLGRRPHMRREEIEQLGHLEEDGLEEWDPWTNSQRSSPDYANVRGPAFAISCFNRLCDFCAILNDIICDTSSGIERQRFCQKKLECLMGLFKKLPFLDQSTNLDPSQQHGSPPHKTYLALLYFTAQLALDFHAQNPSEQRPSDAFARHACEILVLLTQHAQSIGLAVLPPLLEYAMGLSLDGATLARSHFGGTAGLPTFAFWAHKMAEHVDEIKSLWPVFTSLSDILADEEGRGRRSFTLPTTPATHQMNQRLPTTASLSATTNVTATPNAASGMIVQPNLNFWEAISSSSATSIRDQVPPSFDMMMTDITTPTPGSMSMPAGLAMPATSQTSPSFQGDDVDAIFHDLAHLDTTEWTNNREQGLREFGFADDSTFQAFCKDPDRLVDRATPFDPSSMDDNATGFWPPPGFFPEHFEETDPHMEASQILQSLAGNDQYPALPESVGW